MLNVKVPGTLLYNEIIFEKPSSKFFSQRDRRFAEYSNYCNGNLIQAEKSVSGSSDVFMGYMNYIP